MVKWKVRNVEVVFLCVDLNGEVEGKELEVFIPVDSYGEVEGKTY